MLALLPVTNSVFAAKLVGPYLVEKKSVIQITL